MSHGYITLILTRNTQHRLSWIVDTQGWEAKLKLREVDREELSWLQANLKAFNGCGIQDEEGQEESRQVAFKDVAGTVDPNLVFSVIQADLQEDGVNSYLLGPDQQFSQITEHTTGEEQETHAAIQEIECITEILLKREEEEEVGSWRRVFWRTTCRLCHVRIRKGVRANVFRSWTVRFKWAELIAKTEVVPIWQPVSPLEIRIADQRSQTYTNTMNGVCQEHVWRSFPSVRTQAHSGCFCIMQ